MFKILLTNRPEKGRLDLRESPEWHFGGVVNAMPCYRRRGESCIGISFGSECSNHSGVVVFFFDVFGRPREWDLVPRLGSGPRWTFIKFLIVVYIFDELVFIENMSWTCI